MCSQQIGDLMYTSTKSLVNINYLLPSFYVQPIIQIDTYLFHWSTADGDWVYVHVSPMNKEWVGIYIS